MAKMVFIAFPQMGHLNPTLKIARQLRRRGHEVSYVGSLEFRNYVTAQGFPFRAVLDKLSPKGFFPGNLERARQADAQKFEVDDPRVLSLISEVLESLRRSGADLIVIDSLLRDIATLARGIKLPSVLIALTLGEGQVRLASNPYHCEFPTLIACPQEFDFPGTPRGENTTYIESLIDVGRKEVPFDWDRVDPAKPLIYCSLGSQTHMYKQSHDFFAAVAEAMSLRPDRQLILATGGNPKAEDFGATAPNVVVVNWAPQLKILAKASIVITNAGLGTIKDCIFFGTPMIVFPVRWEQPHNAARVAYHGLGVRGHIDSVSTSRILSLIDAIEQNPYFKHRVASMRQVFRQAEAEERGAATIERIVNCES